MNSTELAFNIIKKLESGELKFLIGQRKDHVNFHLNFNDEGIDIKINVAKRTDSLWGQLTEEPYNPDWNKEFKENFYKEKGLINCWYKDCPNQIYQTEHDYKKVKIKCEEKHTRMVCLNHNEK